MNVIIEVSERLGSDTRSYHAQIKDLPAYWGQGNSEENAISDLMRAHKEMFAGNTHTIEYLGRLDR